MWPWTRWASGRRKVGDGVPNSMLCLEKPKLPLRNQHHAESNYLLGETTRNVEGQKEKCHQGRRTNVLRTKTGSWEKPPGDGGGGSQGATIHFSENGEVHPWTKTLGNREMSEWAIRCRQGGTALNVRKNWGK